MGAKGIPEQAIDKYLAIIGKSKKPKNTRKKGKKVRRRERRPDPGTPYFQKFTKRCILWTQIGN
jgi:hypothetical protein